MIEIRFSVETKRGLYTDALVLRNDHGLTDQEIELKKLARVEAWLKSIDECSSKPTPVFEEPAPVVEDVAQEEPAAEEMPQDEPTPDIQE